MAKYDWESAAKDYKAGLLSVRAVAEKHGIPESTLRSKAQTKGWQRDLSDDVRSAAKAKLSRKTSRTDFAHDELRDSDIIEQASDEAADVVLGHRANLNRWRGLSAKLANVLDDMEVGPENHGEYARSLNAGVDAFGKVIKLERQAYGLDEDRGESPGKTIDELMTELAEKEQAE